MTTNEIEPKTLLGLEGRIALVTAVSARIGKRLAHVAAPAGAKVVLVERSQDRLEGVKKEIEIAGGEACVAVADVTESDAMLRHSKLQNSISEWSTCSSPTPVC